MMSARLVAIAVIAAGLVACKAPSEVEARAPEGEPTDRGGSSAPAGEPESIDVLLDSLIVASPVDRERALRALERLRSHDEANAASVPVLIEQLARLSAEPELDGLAGHEGELRAKFCERLGELGDPRAFDLLLATLRASEESQPKQVYKAAIRALGRLGDARAVDELIAVQFRVADVPSTNSIPELAIAATGAIGEAAVPALLDTLAGRNQAVETLAIEKGVDAEIVRLTAVRMLAVVGSPRATADLVEFMPKADCTKRARREIQHDAVSVRAFVANTLGLIGDEAAVPALCSCKAASQHPGDLWEIVAALGRIGGTEAYACLGEIASEGRYDPDEIASPELEFEIRWEAFRWLILAAPADRADEIEARWSKSDAKVRAEVERLGWLEGLAVLRECGEARECYLRVLADPDRGWFVREVAGFNVARRSAPGDLEAAAALAHAFATPHPEARIHFAWLAGRVAGPQACPTCARALEDVLAAEDRSKDPSMQGAWLVARQAIAKFER
jgi:HEAT repeat protein